MLGTATSCRLSNRPVIAEPQRRSGAGTASRTASACWRVSLSTTDTPSTRIYPTQDTSDPEERAWLCLDTSELVACTTHLANTKATVALAQCRYLFVTAIPALPRRGRAEPTVLGADLNLKPHHLPDVRSCLPSGYVRTYDGGTQYIVGSRDLRVSSGTTIGMSKTTDHPGLLGTLSTTAD